MIEEKSEPKPTQDWLNTIVLFSTPLLAIIFVPYHLLTYGAFTGFEWACFAFFMFATGTGITGGYHRLWSHKAYDASAIVRLWYAYWGACATQNSILKWSSDHRRHHRYVDDKIQDPYSAKKGFWFSHMGWILKKAYKGPADLSNVKDLQKDKIIMWQAKHYLALVLFSNVAVPIGLGWGYNMITGSNGSIYGVLILAGLLRFVLNHHFTFFINSACHVFGSQPYSNKDTSRDNFLLALVTYGEGYHNYHHTFQADYRNGICWYHFDPTKWVTKALSWFGLTSNLKTIPDSQIEKQKIMHGINLGKENLYERLNIPTGNEIYQKIENACSDFSQTMNEWLEAHNKFARFCRKTHSDAEKAPYQERIEALQLSIEKQKQQLYEFFQASNIKALKMS